MDVTNRLTHVEMISTPTNVKMEQLEIEEKTHANAGDIWSLPLPIISLYSRGKIFVGSQIGLHVPRVKIWKTIRGKY